MKEKPSAICRQWRVEQTILSLVLNKRGDAVLATLDDGRFLLLPPDDAGEDPKFLPGHDGVSLNVVADADDHGFLSGGDDGCVLLIDPILAAPTRLAEHKGQWIDHVAAESSGNRAYAIGKKLYRLDKEGQPVTGPYDLPSAVGGMAFSPNGKRLAVSHYNGVHLFWTNAPTTEPEFLEWKGSHLSLIWSPDSKFLLSAMQDAALHGWKLGPGLKTQEPGNEMHMQGYETKIASMAFTAGAKFLATSGASQVVCWPFSDGGPWNKEPLTLGGMDKRLVSQVAPHPRDGMVAAGYSDGMIILAPLDGRMEVMILPPIAATGAEVIGLTWNKEGDSLIAALADGHIFLFTLASVSRFVRGQHG